MKANVVFLFCCALTVFSLGAQAQVVAIPDPGLERAIRGALQQETGPLYASKLRQITMLDGTQYEIKDLAGIQYCTNVEVLTFGDNHIRDASRLAGLTKLNYLDLQNNYIEDASFLSNLHEIRSLVLSNNGLTDLTVIENLPNLGMLQAENNRISVIASLGAFPGLADIRLSGNRISSLDLGSGLPYLSALLVSDNQLSSIPGLEFCFAITELRIDGNKFTDLSPLSSMLQLEKLDCSRNNITSLAPVSNFSNLNELYASWNQITAFPAFASALKDVDVSHNLIATIAAQVTPKILANVDFSYNEITDLSPWSNMRTMLSDFRFWNFRNNLLATANLHDVEKLSTLDLSHNQLTSLDGLYNLYDVRLDASYNQITEILALNDLRAVSCDVSHNAIGDVAGLSFSDYGDTIGLDLDLSFNPIADATPLSGLDFAYLDLSWTNVRNVAGLDFHKVERDIRLAGNHLTDLSGILWCDYLEELNLAYNQLNTPGVLSGLPAEINLLDVSSNGITDFAALGLPSAVNRMNASRNHISDAAPVFAALVGNSADAFLADNELESLPALPPPLYDLDVSYNRLTSFPALSGSGLQRIDISHNRLTSLNLDSRIAVVDASSNDLSNVQGVCPYEMDLSHNHISDISGLQAIFYSNVDAPFLNLSHNALSQIDPVSEWMVGGYSYLDFSHNQITSIAPIAQMRGAQRAGMNFAFNNITDFSPLRQVSFLGGYDIAANPTGLVDDLVRDLPGTFAGVSDYQVSDITLLTRYDLEGVSYRGSGQAVDISSLLNRPFRGLRLENVGLENTSMFDKQNMPEYLSLANNEIAAIDLPSPPVFLDVSHNRIHELGSAMLLSEHSSTMNLAQNPINDLTPLLRESYERVPYELMPTLASVFLMPEDVGKVGLFTLRAIVRWGHFDVSKLPLDDYSKETVLPALRSFQIQVVDDTPLCSTEQYRRDMFGDNSACLNLDVYDLTIPAEVQTELLGALLNGAILPLHGEAVAAFENNRMTLWALLYEEVSQDVLPENCLDVLAALATIGDPDLLAALEAFTPAKIPLDVNDLDPSMWPYLSPAGDYDGDGTSNGDEYAADPENYLDDMVAMPAAGLAALALLIAAAVGALALFMPRHAKAAQQK